MIGVLFASVALLLYAWPMLIVKEDVVELRRTYTDSACYPVTWRPEVVCYSEWRLAVFGAVEGVMLGKNGSLEDAYFLWSLVEPKNASSPNARHWHFYQYAANEADARAWVRDLDESTCEGHFVAHRLSFIQYAWDRLRGADKGPFVGLYLHFM